MISQKKNIICSNSPNQLKYHQRINTYQYVSKLVVYFKNEQQRI